MKHLCLLTILCGTFAFAQTTATTPDSRLKAEIRSLLQAMHLDAVMKQQLKDSIPPMVEMMRQNPSVSKEFADEFAKRFEAQILSSHEISDLIVDAYAKRFTLAEIKDLEAFYRSPTGKKMVDVQPELMADVSAKAGTYGQNTAKQVSDQIVQEHPDYIKKQ